MHPCRQEHGDGLVGERSRSALRDARWSGDQRRVIVPSFGPDQPQAPRPDGSVVRRPGCLGPCRVGQESVDINGGNRGRGVQASDDQHALSDRLVGHIAGALPDHPLVQQRSIQVILSRAQDPEDRSRTHRDDGREGTSRNAKLCAASVDRDRRSCWRESDDSGNVRLPHRRRTVWATTDVAAGIALPSCSVWWVRRLSTFDGPPADCGRKHSTAEIMVGSWDWWAPLLQARRGGEDGHLSPKILTGTTPSRR